MQRVSDDSDVGDADVGDADVGDADVHNVDTTIQPTGNGSTSPLSATASDDANKNGNDIDSKVMDFLAVSVVFTRI